MDDVTQQAFVGPPAPQPELTRADTADYLDRANWNPDQARALAAKERLTNLGVHPAVVAQAVPQAAPVASAVPAAASIPPRQPVRSASPVAPVAQPVTPTVPNRAAKPKIDLSAGFVPKAAVQKPQPAGAPTSGGIDLSAGFVPSAPSTASDSTEQPGALSRLGTNAASGAGIMPQEDAKNFFVHPLDTLKQMAQTQGDLGIRAKNELANKDYVRGMTHAVEYLLPGLGPNLAQAGDQLESGDVAGGIGRTIGAAIPIIAGSPEARAAVGKIMPKAAVPELPSASEPVPGAPLTAGEVAGPGLKQSAEKLLSKTGTAQGRMQQVMEGRTAAIRNAAGEVSPEASSPERAGATVQNAARTVLDRQKQAQGLVGVFATRAEQDAEQTRTAATEKAGIEAQSSATEKLHANRTAEIEAGKKTAQDLSGVDELPIPETDREIISSLRGANSAAKIEESAAHNELAENAKAKGIAVDPAPMQSVAKEVVSLEGPAKDLVMSSLPSTVYKTLEKVAGRSTSEADVLASRAKDFGWDADNLTEQQSAAIKKDLADHPAVAGDPETSGPVPYQTMKTARTAVGEALQAARKHFQQTGMGSNASRTLQSLYGSMTDAMKTSLAGDPELSAQFEKANALTRERTSTFVDPKSVRKMVYADDPGKVMGSVMRSGSGADVEALRTALDADKTGQGLARAQRGAMDYVLRRSTKGAKVYLPGSVNPESIDYDLALRNAKASPPLRTILGDEKYNKFLSDLDAKRLAQRTPDQIVLENQLQKIIKSETPEKAAKAAGVDVSQDATVKSAALRAGTAKSVLERLKAPSATEAGPQTIAEHAANDLEPSRLVERAAKSPEYTDKLLTVLDKSPNAQVLRTQLAHQIFRSASDNAVVRGAFGSTDGIFDVAKFQDEYASARPSLGRILPADNLSAMDDFNKSLNKYALSKGVGGGAGMSGRFLAMRQLFGALALVKGVVSLSPATAAGGAALIWGPRLWMELATRPELASRASEILSKGSGPAAAGTAIAGAANGAQIPQGTGFQRPEMEEHKTAGMAAAAEAPNTPDHLRPHLRKMAGTSVPEKGAIVMLPGGQRATVEYSSPHDKTPVVKVRMEDGKAIRYIGRKEVDALRPAGK